MVLRVVAITKQANISLYVICFSGSCGDHNKAAVTMQRVWFYLGFFLKTTAIAAEHLLLKI